MQIKTLLYSFLQRVFCPCPLGLFYTKLSGNYLTIMPTVYFFQRGMNVWNSPFPQLIWAATSSARSLNKKKNWACFKGPPCQQDANTTGSCHICWREPSQKTLSHVKCTNWLIGTKKSNGSWTNQALWSCSSTDEWIPEEAGYKKREMSHTDEWSIHVNPEGGTSDCQSDDRDKETLKKASVRCVTGSVLYTEWESELTDATATSIHQKVTCNFLMFKPWTKTHKSNQLSGAQSPLTRLSAYILFLVSLFCFLKLTYAFFCDFACVFVYH